MRLSKIKSSRYYSFNLIMILSVAKIIGTNSRIVIPRLSISLTRDTMAVSPLTPQLSDNVIDDLNHMAGALNAKDYNSALIVHTKMAQTANFSEVGSFLPGLKVLLQVRWFKYTQFLISAPL